MALTDAVCRTSKPGEKTYKLSDAGGLQLWIHPSGSRTWRLAYRFEGKQKMLSLGTYPTLSLAFARAARGLQAAAEIRHRSGCHTPTVISSFRG
jgi:hypothetical protein